MLVLLLAASLATAQVPDSAHVVIAATTDVHGRATAWDYLADQPFGGGIVRVATVLDSLRARYPGQVVVLDAGDLLEGNPFATYFARVAPRDPHPIIEALNVAGYDGATPGNHDFDWGVPVLRRAVAEAAFPYVSANLYATTGDTLLYPAYRVLRRQGVRVGVTGFTTPGVMLWDRDQLRKQVRVARVEEAAPGTIQAMRRESDLVVVLAHTGLGGAASYDTTGIGAEHAAASLAGLPARPDIVIVGHSHRALVDSVIGGVHFVQPRPYAAAVSVVHVDLVREGGGWRIRRVRADLVSTDGVTPSALVTRRLAPRHDSVTAWLDTPVGEALGPMRSRAARAQATPIVNFINDVQRRRTGADLSATPAFNLRAGFDSGPIQRRQILALYPYENTLRAVRISGAQLKAYLEWSARYFLVDPAGRVSLDPAIPGYDFDIVSGARYEIDLRRPVGERIRRLSIRGRLVQPTNSFTLAVNNHRQTGGGGYDMLREAPVVYDRGESIPDLLVNEIATRSPLDPSRYARKEWRLVPEVSANAVRDIFDVPAPPPPVAARDTVVLRILATGDLRGDGPALAALDRAADSLGEACECPTLRLDGGDALQGTLVSAMTAGRAPLDLLNRFGLGASVVGDLDLAWPLDTLRRRMAEARYPWLAANVFDSATGRRPDWAVPFRVLEAGGFRVAVIGYVTPDAKTLLPPERTRGLRLGEGELAIHDVLTSIRGQQPFLTVLLAHTAATCEGVVCDGELVRLAEQLGQSGIRLIVTGHSRRPVHTQVAGISVIGPGGPGALGVADLVKTPAGGHDLRTRVDTVVGDVRGDPALGAPLDTYRRRSDSADARVVAQLKRPLLRRGTQYPLGALIAEARRNLLRADLGLVPTAAIAADLPAGPVTYARLSAVEPGRNYVVGVELSGTQLRALLEQSLSGLDPSLQVAGARVRYDPQAKAGRRIKEIVFQGGRKLRPEQQYLVATDEETAAGPGDPVLSGAPRRRSPLLDVEAVAAFLRRLPQPVEVDAAAGFVSTRR